MNTEALVKVSIAALIILGYGAIVIVYMVWGPVEPNRTLDTLLGAITSGYLIVLQSLFGKSSV